MRLRLEYAPERRISPLSPWVHRGVDAPFWRASSFEPPMPNAAPGQGYPVWTLEHRGREIFFVSPEEIDHAIDILGREILPTSRDLGQPYLAVNSHWLSRLHRSWKPWKVRQRMVRALRSAPQTACPQTA
ncbi:MAG: hypothetical protein R3C52_02045 [Hyphomonadaceae bacterium]